MNFWITSNLDYSQDNGLEANNNVIKSHHSLRRRLPLGLNNAEHMLHQWSVDRTKHKVFEHSVNISINECKLTYTWMKDCGRILSVVDQTDSFIVHKSKYDS